MKIALVGSWNLAHGYLGAAKALRAKGCTVEFVPAQKYVSENPKTHLTFVLDHLKKIQADVVLWWRAETLNSNQFKKVRNEISGKFIMFSWDDPFQWESHPEMSLKCRHLDAAFSCCMDSVEKYNLFGVKKAVYCPPGFDPEIHYPDYDEKYKCDVSLVCTNFYHGQKLTRYPHISRKLLCEWIVELAPEIDFKLYGLESFKDDFPNNYAGWIDFNESRKVFSSSKINICTHIRPDGDMYINERVTQILGSGGLLFVDHVKGIEKVLDLQKECVVMNTENPAVFIEQIKGILNNYDNYLSVRERGHEKALSAFTWDLWADIILKEIK